MQLPKIKRLRKLNDLEKAHVKAELIKGGRKIMEGLEDEELSVEACVGSLKNQNKQVLWAVRKLGFTDEDLEEVARGIINDEQKRRQGVELSGA